MFIMFRWTLVRNKALLSRPIRGVSAGPVNAAASSVVDSIHTCSVRNHSSGIALSHTHSAIFNGDQWALKTVLNFLKRHTCVRRHKVHFIGKQLNNNSFLAVSSCNCNINIKLRFCFVVLTVYLLYIGSFNIIFLGKSAYCFANETTSIFIFIN